MVAGLCRLARAIRLVALGAAERGHQPDGDEKRAVLFADDLERRDIFFVAAGAQAPHRISARKLRDIRSQVARFERNLFRGAAHAHRQRAMLAALERRGIGFQLQPDENHGDRKSTRLNSSHSQISYAVFCLKKKKKSVSASRLALASAVLPDSN